MKIGYTNGNVCQRIASLQTGCDGELVLLGVIPGQPHDERALHARFRAHHVRGEWFGGEPALLAGIADAISLSARLALLRGEPPQAYASPDLLMQTEPVKTSANPLAYIAAVREHVKGLTTTECMEFASRVAAGRV